MSWKGWAAVSAALLWGCVACGGASSTRGDDVIPPNLGNGDGPTPTPASTSPATPAMTPAVTPDATSPATPDATAPVTPPATRDATPLATPTATPTATPEDCSEDLPGDGIDQDCNGVDAVRCFVDDDGDGAAGERVQVEADGDCSEARLYTAATDCDDDDPNRHPGREERVGDGVDQDCNGFDSLRCHVDHDGDGVGVAETFVAQEAARCSDAGGSDRSDDCDDDNAARFPGNAEVPGDGVDQDCSGEDSARCQRDADGDGVGTTQTVISDDADCADPGESLADDDCLDSDDSVYPGAPELCDGVDRDCDEVWRGEVPAVCADIAAAIAAASPGAIIEVAPGTYTGEWNTEGKALTLRGRDGAAATTLEGTGVGSVLTIISDEARDTIVEGFTITGGLAEDGGGIYVADASPTLRDLIVSGNAANGQFANGGGIYVGRGSPRLERLTVVNNTSAYLGGGIHLRFPDAVQLRNLVVVGNNATWGGGIGTGSNATGTMENIIVAQNTARAGGGGIYVFGSGFSLYNLTVLHNSAREGGGLRLRGAPGSVLINVAVTDNVASDAGGGGGVQVTDHDQHRLSYCNLFANTPENHAGAPDPVGHDGNLSVPPGYVDTSAPNARLWDLTLRSDSQMRDAGDPLRSDPDQSAADIGAYGGARADNW